MKYKGKPVGIIMADALFEEEHAALKEEREPSTKKAIAVFERLTGNTIPYHTVVKIFDLVFPEYLKARDKHINGSNGA